MSAEPRTAPTGQPSTGPSSPTRAEQLVALGMRPDAPRTKRTVEEAIALTGGKPPTPDDVTILSDGRRLRTRADIEAWIGELAALDGEP